MLVRYNQKKYTDYNLWEEFQEGFEGWTVELFNVASREAIKDLRTYLLEHGVWVEERKGRISYAQTLVDILEEEEPHEWTDEDFQNLSARFVRNRREPSAISNPTLKETSAPT
jgi:hypothetical protein